MWGLGLIAPSEQRAQFADGDHHREWPAGCASSRSLHAVVRHSPGAGGSCETLRQGRKIEVGVRGRENRRVTDAVHDQHWRLASAIMTAP
jgi:hypothetical protein